MQSVELFVGAGGLALGTANAGLTHRLVLDWDTNASETIRHNKKRGLRHVGDWHVFAGDDRGYDVRRHAGSVEFVFGGRPCQPFSLGGKHRGNWQRSSQSSSLLPERESA